MDAHLIARQSSRSCLTSSIRRLTLSDSARTGPVAARQQQHQQIRYRSSASRTKRALNIPPHPSFLSSGLPGSAAPTAAIPSSSSQPSSGDHIIFNPPAAAPSVYHTPFKFLPKSDPRRRANLNVLFSSSTTVRYSDSPAAAPAELPPRVEHETYSASRHHLTQEQVAEIRQLREKDPLSWSVQALARKYECSPIFVMMVVQAPREHKDEVHQRLNSIRTRWGPKKAQARDDRRRRRDMLYNGEL